MSTEGILGFLGRENLMFPVPNGLMSPDSAGVKEISGGYSPAGLEGT
jgi:hypothetical protein